MSIDQIREFLYAKVQNRIFKKMKTIIALGLITVTFFYTNVFAQNPYQSLSIDSFITSSSAYSASREIEANANLILKSSEARINHAKAHTIELNNDVRRVGSYYKKQQMYRYNKHLRYVQDTEIQRAKREGRLSKETLDELFDPRDIR